MNCINCYREIPDDAVYCPYCGTRQIREDNTGSDSHKEDHDNTQETTDYSGTGTFDSSQYNAQQNERQQSYYEGEQTNWVPYLILSIISTLCCCIPGIAAIYYAVKINSCVSAGKYEEAQKAGKNARIWIIVSFIAGILMWVLFMLFIVGILGVRSYCYYY